MTAHNLFRVSFGTDHAENCLFTVLTSTRSRGKNLLWTQSRRVTFQTRSIGFKSGLYGGKNDSFRTFRFRRRNGLSRRAWWYLELSMTRTIRRPFFLRLTSRLRNASKVTPLKISELREKNVPSWDRTAPKYPVCFIVGAWSMTGSFNSGGIHIRHRLPCCWKWHSSTNHKSTDLSFAYLWSFFKRHPFYRVRMSYQGSGFPLPKAQFVKKPLALANLQFNSKPLFKEMPNKFPVPQILCKTQITRGFPERLSKLGKLLGIQRGRTSASLTFLKSGKPASSEAINPIMNSPASLTEVAADLLNRNAPAQEQQTVKPVIVPRILGTGNLLLERYRHSFCIFNNKSTHIKALLVTPGKIINRAFYMQSFMTLCIVSK